MRHDSPPASPHGCGDVRDNYSSLSHTAFVSVRVQYHAPQHPVVACVLGEYDEEVSTLNECIALSKGGGYGGMNCVLEALQTCTESVS